MFRLGLPEMAIILAIVVLLCTGYATRRPEEGFPYELRVGPGAGRTFGKAFFLGLGTIGSLFVIAELWLWWS